MISEQQIVKVWAVETWYLLACIRRRLEEHQIGGVSGTASRVVVKRQVILLGGSALEDQKQERSDGVEYLCHFQVLDTESKRKMYKTDK